MNNECGIIRDLLPLYAENIASPETVKFVEEHLKTCEACRKEYERMKEPQAIDPNSVQADVSTAPLLKLKRKMRAKRILTVAATAMFVIALLVSAFSFLKAPKYIPYSKDLLSVTVNDDNTVTVTFDKKVTNYMYDLYYDPHVEGSMCYHISAWTSLWDEWFSSNENAPSTFTESALTPIYYDSNNGKEDVCVYGEPLAEPGSGVTSLPRITLGYYFIIAVALFAILLAARIIFRKKENIRVWIERIFLYPLSYAIAHLLVVGFSFVTYSISRDFPLIIFISLLLWCGALIAHGILKNRKEIKEISQALDEQNE